ncbi:RimJ/RimL family protein N-acetyltransferase [Streptococcus rupicaprae]|uniref:RimJ/RimL family protein N-acetyltransferase n=1 Tax=Streptococcus rupicaprae TaxID=759619 RepID=A0ABV2FI57_9STRE
MLKKEVVFREASQADAASIIAFFNQVGRESDYLIMDENGYQGTEKALAQSLEDSLKLINQLCLLALVDEEVIGMLNIRAGRQLRIEHIGDVFIAVRKNYWGHGIGHILMEEAVDWAVHSGIIRRLELTVQVRNQRAIALYEQFGFEIEGTQKRGAKTENGEFLDVYLMGKLIDEEGE